MVVDGTFVKTRKLNCQQMFDINQLQTEKKKKKNLAGKIERSFVWCFQCDLTQPPGLVST